MTKDDIIRMAREAGAGIGSSGRWLVTQDELERFTTLVAAAEREKVNRWEIGSGFTPGSDVTIEDLLVGLEQQIREDEREACAKVCDGKALEAFSGQCAVWGDFFAKAIRARGNA